MLPKVSVIVPVYNVEKYIERCVRSLFEQTLKELEYVFVDDCSTDSSISIIERLCSEYTTRTSQVKIIRFTENRGVHVARLTGIEQATGRYLIHCDSDDWVDENMYYLLYEKAQSSKADIVFCDYHTIDGKGGAKCYHQYISDNRYKILSDLLIGKLHGSLCNKLILASLLHTEFIKPAGFFREDLVISIQAVIKSNMVTYLECDKPMYYYRIDNQSITRVIGREKLLNIALASFANTKVIIDIIDRNDLSNILRKELLHIKLTAKLAFKKVVLTREERNKWMKNIYPEINRTFWRDRYASLRLKVEYILVMCGIYNVVMNIYKKVLMF